MFALQQRIFFSFSSSSSSLASIRYLRLSTLCVVVDVLYLFFFLWVWVCFAYSLSLLLFLDVHVHVHDHGRFGRGKLEREREEEGRKTDVAVESVLGEGTSGGEGGERVRLEKPVCYTIKFFFYLVSMAIGGRERETKMCGREGERGENQWSAFIYIIRDDLMPDISSFLSLFFFFLRYLSLTRMLVSSDGMMCEINMILGMNLCE